MFRHEISTLVLWFLELPVRVEVNRLLEPKSFLTLADKRPTLIVVIDTEEQFDWSQPHDRNSVSVSAMQHIGRAQSIFDRFKVRPCYVTSYAVASQPKGYEPLLGIFQERRCCVGAHLHPWVTPPHDEALVPANSFPGNLPMLLEEAKLRALTEQIESVFGERPVIYKAGRYGLGPNTQGILERLGYRIDLSPTPGFNYSAEEGPDFESFPNHLYRFGTEDSLLCIPCSGGFVGYMGRHSIAAYRIAQRPILQRVRATGILARLGAADRIRLSPEGYSLEELKRLTRHLFRQGVRVLTLSFHSPSVVPGCTPYVTNRTELAAFLSRIEAYLEFFSTEMQGEFSDPTSVLKLVDSGPAGPGP